MGLLILLAVPAQIRAQEGPVVAVRKGTPRAKIDTMVVEGAFLGIVISQAQREKAFAILHASDEEADKIDRADPRAVEKVRAATRRRNATLRALLSSPQDRTRFDENVSNAAGPPRQ